MATLYEFQARVDALIRSGRSIILQAPTGAGKTRAALFPFLDGWRNNPTAFPRQCIYAVPMRVLANQFKVEYDEIVAHYNISQGFNRDVSIQTGARSEDRRLEADLVFLTIDQVLSSFLTIPYSLGHRLANLNAGALIGSYLVFDEFHLFPLDEHGNGAMATTLHMLKMLKGIAPFVLMTATFSQTMIERLCTELDAVPVTLTQPEIDAIPSQQGKQRRYHYRSQVLTPDAVIEDFKYRRHNRVLAICNTVARAQTLARALRDDPRLADVTIELLHSRFYSSDRTTKEDRVRREFGEDRATWTSTPMILVATQVIEVGLNITCDALHTEMAPAASLVQRAGRCARFANEQGDVFIYDVPIAETTSEPDYAPYLDEGQRAVCERTRDVIHATLPMEGKVLKYHAELDIVNAAHTPFDMALLEQLHTNRHSLRKAVENVLEQQDRSAARELIRDIDNRMVIIHPDPNPESVPNPYLLESIGMRRNTLLGWYTRVQEHAWQQGLDWVAAIATVEEQRDSATGEGSEQGRRLTTHWQHLRPSDDKATIRAACDDLASGGFIVALNPALVQYDDVLGFRAEPGNNPAPASRPAESRPKERPYHPIRHESYAEHIAGLYRVYTRILRERTAAVRARLEQRYKLEPGMLDRAIRLMFAIHDLGKLDQVWQKWAHAWQRKVSVLRNDPALAFADDYMAAHTDYDSDDQREREAQSKVMPKRPNHAAESARAGRNLIRAIAGDNDALYAAMVSAIICHHSPTLRGEHGPFKPAGKAARHAFADAIKAVGLFDDALLRASGAKVDWNGFPQQEDLSGDVIDVRRVDDVVLYLFLVRILRMADQESQEK